MPDKAPNEPTMYPGLSTPAYYATDDGQSEGEGGEAGGQ
jgi:hypothetical protein